MPVSPHASSRGVGLLLSSLKLQYLVSSLSEGECKADFRSMFRQNLTGNFT